MGSNDQVSKELIKSTVKAMIEEEMDLNKITVRQIAERAGIGVGLINYYFQSKNNLVGLVIGEMMSEMVQNYFTQESTAELDPIIKLKTMLKGMYAFGGKYEKYVNYLISHSIMDGDMGAELLLIPKLKAVLPNKNEFELRVIALQILLPIQVTSLNSASFRLYSGIDLRDGKQMEKFLDLLIDNILHSNSNLPPREAGRLPGAAL